MTINSCRFEINIFNDPPHSHPHIILDLLPLSYYFIVLSYSSTSCHPILSHSVRRMRDGDWRILLTEEKWPCEPLLHCCSLHR